MNSSKELSDRRMLIGLRIRHERIIWGMTQEELGSVLGVTTNYIGQIERGNRNLSRKMEDRLCSLFHMDRNELHSPKVHYYTDRVGETDLMMPQLAVTDIRRMLDSCSEEELRLCGHVLRSMLLYLRRPGVPPFGSATSSGSLSP